MTNCLFHKMRITKVAAFAAVVLMVPPVFAKTHKEVYEVTCSVLWPAVKDTLRNSGKYGIISINNEEMTASYNIGGTLTGKRINSIILNTKNNTCEMQIQTAFSGLANNDAADMRKRVEASLAKLKADSVAKP